MDKEEFLRAIEKEGFKNGNKGDIISVKESIKDRKNAYKNQYEVCGRELDMNLI